jgi:hypothetical protein
MFSSRCISVKVINNIITSRLIHRKIKDIEPQIIKETKLKRSKRCVINVKI